jgi:hypothetical protein
MTDDTKTEAEPVFSSPKEHQLELPFEDVEDDTA